MPSSMRARTGFCAALAICRWNCTSCSVKTAPAARSCSIVVMKRSMSPGFAGIDNELYLDPKTTMLFGDAKESVVKLISAVKSA